MVVEKLPPRSCGMIIVENRDKLPRLMLCQSRGVGATSRVYRNKELFSEEYCNERAFSG